MLVKSQKRLIIVLLDNLYESPNERINYMTHYEAIVIDTSTRNIILIDPSRNTTGAIYDADAIDKFINYYKDQISEYIITWLGFTSPCQIDRYDVYCESWTMYLLIQLLKVYRSDKHDYIIDIPESLYDKYNVLLKLYSQYTNRKYLYGPGSKRMIKKPRDFSPYDFRLNRNVNGSFDKRSIYRWTEIKHILSGSILPKAYEPKSTK
jgi:hypothetical protein